MKRIESLVRLFYPNEKLQITETFKEVEVRVASIYFNVPKIEELTEHLSTFPNRDNISLHLEMDNAPVATYHTSIDKGIDSFITLVRNRFDIKDEDSMFDLRISITKKVDSSNKSTIYSFADLLNYLNSLKLRGLIYSFSQVLDLRKHIIFESDDIDKPFYTYTFVFSNSSTMVELCDCNKELIIDNRKLICTRRFLSDKRK